MKENGKTTPVGADLAGSGLREVAKVGLTPDPETDAIERHTIGNLTLWDTPGLGDTARQDLRNKEAIQSLPAETDEEGNPLVDLVLMVMDASGKDLGATCSVLNDVIIPAVEDPGRILAALDQADLAMKHGRHCDYAANRLDKTLRALLEEKARSVREAFAHNDGEMDYGACVEGDFFETLGSMIGDGAEAGADLGGMLLGRPEINALSGSDTPGRRSGPPGPLFPRPRR